MDLLWQACNEALHLILSGDAATLRIAGLSLLVSSAATALAALVGVPLGAWLAIRNTPSQRLLVLLIHTGMGVPPVVVGLLVAILLWRSGPLGSLGLLYTPTAMIIAQWIVAAPIAAGITRSALLLLERDLISALRVDGAAEWQVGWELIRAARSQVLVAVAAAFGRAISEVGASLMVGGNILNATRILTTAITLEVGRGEFARAIALGIVLLTVALLVNGVLVRKSAT